MMRPTARRAAIASIAAVFFSADSVATITVTVDKLDPSDGVPMPPPNLVLVDVHVAPPPTAAFSSVGIRGLTANGARLVYAYDANGVVPSAPGVENRFVSFFSRPRGRDDDSRYVDGLAGTGNSSCGPAPTAYYYPGLIDASGFYPNLPNGLAGYVLRIAIDLSGVGDPLFQTDSPSIVVAHSRPSDSLVLFETGCPFNNPGCQVWTQFGQSVSFNFGIYGIIPEPGTGLLALSLGALTCFTIRRSRR